MVFQNIIKGSNRNLLCHIHINTLHNTRNMKNIGAMHFLLVTFLWTLNVIPFVFGQESNDFASAMQMLQLVNNARIQRNIRPLCLSDKLVRAATAHSAYQASINTMTHDGPLSLGDRFIRQGYQPSAVAENVGFTSTPFTQVVFDIWMSSPEHRANILDPSYVHFGSANSKGSNNMYFWTQLFAKPMSMITEPCDFNAATAAARLTPGPNGFNPNGAFGVSSNLNSYTPGMSPNGNCVSVDDGFGGKTLNCKMTGPAAPGGYNAIPYRNGPNTPLFGPNPIFGPAGPNSINNPPGYDGTTCTVVSTAPAPDGQGSVRVFKCSSNPPGVGGSTGYNPSVTPYVNPGIDGSAVIINPENPAGYNPPGYNPPGYNPPGTNIIDGNPPGYNPPGYNPPGYNPPGTNIVNGNPPGYNPPGYNPPGYNPPGYNPPGYNPPGTNLVDGNPPGYNPPGYNPPGYNPPGYNPPGYNPPGTNIVNGNPPGYNPPGYNPPGYNPPGSSSFWA